MEKSDVVAQFGEEWRSELGLDNVFDEKQVCRSRRPI